jgi:hypothetical protein
MEKIMTVQELRNMGYKAKVLHFRNHIDKQRFCGFSSNLSEKGGTTKIIIDSPTGEHFEGIAKCSNKDNYDKKLGVRIALGRSGVAKFIESFVNES